MFQEEQEGPGAKERADVWQGIAQALDAILRIYGFVPLHDLICGFKGPLWCLRGTSWRD